MDFKNKSRILMTAGIGILSVLVLGSTVAYYSKVLFNDYFVDTTTHGLEYYINYSKGQDITSATLTTSSAYTEAITNTSITFYKKDDSYDIYGHIYLDINEIGTNLANIDALKYTLVNNDKVIMENTLEGSKSGDSILIKGNIPLSTNEQIFTLYIWLDSEKEFDLAIRDELLSVTVRCEATMKEIDVIAPASCLINNLYFENKDTSKVANNNIEYAYASSVNLMNDRLGGKTINYDNGNIRYYGSNPNNYIYFNCNDYSNQSSSTCEKWRIIGLFDGKLKLIRNENIGSFAWDNKSNEIGSSSSDNGSNDWTDSRLMMLLNSGYEDGVVSSDDKAVYKYEGSLYWNAKSGMCYSDSLNQIVSCDFTSTGLKNDTTRNMIEEVNWNLGALSSSLLYSDTSYISEREEGAYLGRPTTWIGKVALIYPSDYGYATDFKLCSNTLTSYNALECYKNDWLYSGYYWTLTSYLSTSYSAWVVDDNVEFSVTYGKNGVRPVIYLDPKLNIETNHTGTNLDPYRISVS